MNETASPSGASNVLGKQDKTSHHPRVVTPEKATKKASSASTMPGKRDETEGTTRVAERPTKKKRTASEIRQILDRKIRKYVYKYWCIADCKQPAIYFDEATFMEKVKEAEYPLTEKCENFEDARRWMSIFCKYSDRVFVGTEGAGFYTNKDQLEESDDEE